ncbi:hypothetical protein [Actinacidiphila epipremni]|uniref:DUF2637 domain-containing protein n=1 Tax=Actinacidiphila epipremni TaxID=2053013 RepID=A0ABX0ZET8_9ACTN|nr:hypothetical protein [Actinacidiphila epipremni]NJP42290.1 hypothetical protein [Actinacidiphila epipremni]
MTGRPLTRTQAGVLGAAMLGMLAIGAAGARGTYSNLTSIYSGSTALGAVAAGEGATLILALAYVGLVMLGQGAPRTVRAGLWLLPAVGSALGAVAAGGARTTVVYAATPLAMVAAAEGVGLLARRIVVRTTGEDVEARRRTAAAVRALAYEQARAERHPDEAVRQRAARRAWRLARRVGADDTALGEQLLDVQRVRLTEGADAALAAMFAPAVTPARDAVGTSVTPALDPAPEPAVEQPPAAETGTPVPGAVTQVIEPEAPAAALAELAVVAGVPTPTPGDALSGEQLVVVLRWLRYQEDPPRSYRAAVTAFRDAGYVGSEERVRRAWGDLMSREEDGTTAR